MALYIFARFEPRPGRETELLEELRRVLEPTRKEPGCIHIHLYESVRGPRCYFIHSKWTGEAAFEKHATLPHMTRFLSLMDELISHPLHAVRTHQID